MAPDSKLTFNPNAVAYSLGMLAGIRRFNLGYFVSESITESQLETSGKIEYGLLAIAKTLYPELTAE